jgi:8-oxo-dGTP pyrophosphatase MutT (NUDIX family)
MPRDPIPTWFFAVAVVRRGDRFLIVHERKRDQPWYLPAGRVERGESFAEAAVRETLEEAGVPVRLTGVIRVEHSPRKDSARVRAVFLAEPTDDTPPKSVADHESLGAAWVTLGELDRYRLRGPEVRELFAYVLAGGPFYPVDLIRPEGTAFAALSVPAPPVPAPVAGRAAVGVVWTVFRVDDNGNQFAVRGGLTRPEADRLVADFEARGHKQTYWAEPSRG